MVHDVRRGRLAGPFLLVALAGFALQAQAKSVNLTRPEIKCAIYKDIWAKSAGSRDMRGIGRAFIEKHDAFIAGGCTGAHDVCPRSKEELDLANLLVIQSMNAGMASTFAPFGCPK